MITRSIKRMLDDLGQALTLRTYSSGTYDPATGLLSNSSTDYTVKGYVANYKLQEIDNQSVVLGDRKVYLSIYDTSYDAIPVPESGDEILGVGDTVNIVGVQTLYHAGDRTCYICQVRE